MSKQLSVKQAAKEIGLSETAVRELCSSGVLQHRRVGAKRGRIRIDETEVQDYLERTRIISAPAACPEKNRATHQEGLGLLRAGGYRPRGALRV